MLSHTSVLLEMVQADAIARYFRLTGHDTFFLTGTDENSLKNVRAAAELGITTEELCNRNSAAFQALIPGLNISTSDFIRTSQETRHSRGAQKFWLRTRPGDIYKKYYTGLYCVGCEDFYTEKDVPSGVCPEHQTPLERVEEENYFFRLSAYQNQLIKLIETEQLRIVPATRKNEMLAFAKGGLHDFSISRSRERASNWGIPVPGDSNQVMYVWYDALADYITALDYADEGERLEKYWIECNKRFMSSARESIAFIRSTGQQCCSLLGCRFLMRCSYTGILQSTARRFQKALAMCLIPWLKRKSMVWILCGTTCCGACRLLKIATTANSG